MRFLVPFFFTAAHFHLALWASSICQFVTTATELSCCGFQQKKCLLCFLSLALDLCRPLSRWTSLACCLLSLFLCLSLALCSTFVNMAINLSLIPSKTRIQKQFPLSIFFVIDSLIVSASQDAGGYAIFRENNLELLLGYRLNELFYIGMPVVRTDGRAVGRSGGVRSRAYQIFSDG